MDNTLSQEPMKSRTMSWPFIVGIIALLLALPRGWPHGYYQLLRFLVCGVAVWGIFQAYRQRRIAWIGLLIGMAVLFNPIDPIHFPKNTWILIDLTAAGLLGLFAIEIQLGPNTDKTPFYRRLGNWLDQDVSDPKVTPYVSTRYERFTSRAANAIGIAVFAALLGFWGYAFFDLFPLHLEDIPFGAWFLLLGGPVFYFLYGWMTDWRK